MTNEHADTGAIIREMMEVKRKIDLQWADGNRTGMMMATYGIADAVILMLKALDADDANAFVVAVKEARDSAYSGTIHGSNWRKQFKAGQQ